MLKTPLCDLLGIEKPVFQGGMAWIADASLASAVSEAGGLGIIAAMNADANWLRDQIHELRAKTDKPFGVNVMLMSPFADEVAQVVNEHARLRVLGLRELLLGGTPALLAGPRAHLVGNGEHLGGRRRCLDQVDAHRGVLGTLAGKQKRYATHAHAPFRTCSAPSTRSSTISRALWRSLTMPAICPHKNEPSS